MSKQISIIIILFSMVMGSCQYFEPAEEKEFVAKVNDSYLYKEDIDGLVVEGVSREDSTIIINNYINKWATQQLLIDRARVNLSFEEQEELEELVQRYKSELYTKAYADAYVAKKLDTTINKPAIAAYYEENRENFKLNEDLIKLRYISISKKNTNLSEVKKYFKEFKEEDIEALEGMVLQFNSYSFNDSIWAKTRQVYNRIPLLSSENRSEFLKKSIFLELEDSLTVYLMHVNDVKLRNEEAPLVYVEPTIKQILLNKKKLKLIEELEKNITKDAIKNKKFEINN